MTTMTIKATAAIPPYKSQLVALSAGFGAATAVKVAEAGYMVMSFS